MSHLKNRAWAALLAGALALALPACAPKDHPYSAYGGGAHGGGNR